MNAAKNFFNQYSELLQDLPIFFIFYFFAGYYDPTSISHNPIQVAPWNFGIPFTFLHTEVEIGTMLSKCFPQYNPDNLQFLHIYEVMISLAIWIFS